MPICLMPNLNHNFLPNYQFTLLDADLHTKRNLISRNKQMHLGHSTCTIIFLQRKQTWTRNTRVTSLFLYILFILLKLGILVEQFNEGGLQPLFAGTLDGVGYIGLSKYFKQLNCLSNRLFFAFHLTDVLE